MDSEQLEYLTQFRSIYLPYYESLVIAHCESVLMVMFELTGVIETSELILTILLLSGFLIDFSGN